MSTNRTRASTLAEPSVFRRYLLTRGWEENAPRGNALRFVRATDKGTVEVEIPDKASFADYERRVEEALAILALVEGSSVADIRANLAMPSMDIVSFRFTGDASVDGLISLEDSYRLRKARKQLLLAVAHSVVEPRAHFARLSRTQPMEFLATCREAPSRPGSYISPVVIPISPAIGARELDAPFARQVTELLARALWLTMDALDRGNDDALLQNPTTGLSANFLTALAELAPPGGRGSLDIDFSWSPSRPVPDVPSRVCLGDWSFAPLGEAARVLRETSEVPGCELEGYIVRLERQQDEPGDQPGDVVLATTLDYRAGTSRVHITLDPNPYGIAAKAHVDGAQVRITGTLVQRGRKFTLENPGGIDVLPGGE